ncbi:V-type ATP synthase subunit I [Flexistipes sinusarabici]|uniref:V-type ATP synthase subunit I n=2 Tax=Flexistipes sinusarabici TaxID=2352 RepID=UPI0023561CFD|nr:V-type ATPase 116kDa subunit family protein [Flexistipes sinusarabici]
MSKVRIVGPKECSDNVLNVIQQLECMQIERFEEEIESPEKRYHVTEKEITEKVYLEEFKQKINELFSYLPEVEVRKSYINPVNVLDFLKNLVDKHKEYSRTINEEINNLNQNLSSLEKHRSFLTAFEDIATKDYRLLSSDAVGLILKDKKYLENLNLIVEEITDNAYEVFSRILDDKSIAVIYVFDERFAEPVRKKLSMENVKEYQFPEELESKSFFQKLSYISDKIKNMENEILRKEDELHNFAVRWLPVYQSVLNWINARLNLISAKNIIYETKYCFVIFGWLPSKDLEKLKSAIADYCLEEIDIKELEITQADLNRIPVMLHNSTYFKPFSLFTRFLPLPSYTSFDPTIFIGIFLPVFFGMILGDMGYGIIILIISLAMIFLSKPDTTVSDAGKVFSVCAVYTIIFGFLYGEFFGSFGRHTFGLEPILVDREEEILTTAYLAVSIGVFHVLLGLVLNGISSIRSKNLKSFITSLAMTVLIAASVVLLVVLFKWEKGLLSMSLIWIIVGLTVVLVILGGLIAPLEILKSMGNIISYVRIMAIGLASVMLAHVANMLSGKAGNIFLGIFIAVLLHLLNLLLGVFSPTIHSLRLNYVEFFSKFLESEGKGFKPLKK